MKFYYANDKWKYQNGFCVCIIKIFKSKNVILTNNLPLFFARVKTQTHILYVFLYIQMCLPFRIGFWFYVYHSTMGVSYHIVYKPKDDLLNDFESIISIEINVIDWRSAR